MVKRTTLLFIKGYRNSKHIFNLGINVHRQNLNCAQRYSTVNLGYLFWSYIEYWSYWKYSLKLSNLFVLHPEKRGLKLTIIVILCHFCLPQKPYTKIMTEGYDHETFHGSLSIYTMYTANVLIVNCTYLLYEINPPIEICFIYANGHLGPEYV